MSRVIRSIVALGLAGAALLGCKTKLPKSTEIVHMRVLGMKLEVMGDETRTTPKPGEQVSVTLQTVFPSSKQTGSKMQSLLIGCTAPTRYTGGLPVCQEFLDAAISGGGADVNAALPRLTNGRFHCSDLLAFGLSSLPETGGVAVSCLSTPSPLPDPPPDPDPVTRTFNPKVSITVAPNFVAAQKLLIGVVCERGDPFLDAKDPLLFGCKNNSGETLRINAVIPIQHKDADKNANPRLVEDDKDKTPDLAIKFESSPMGKWDVVSADTSLAEKNCAALPDSSTLPKADYLKHSLTLTYRAAAREKVGNSFETLELSAYATDGELDHRFTTFAGSDKGKGGLLEGKVDWTPPPKQEIPKTGTLVRFFFTIRDGRGGFGITSRALCVHYEPPSTAQ